MDVAFPEVADLAAVPTGDMPGDKVQITPGHIDKAKVVFPALWRLLEPLLADPRRRAVVAVCGGSGVGKSETGSLLAYGLNTLGVGAYVLSGDNYPLRVPVANDAERLRTFRVAGLQGVVASGAYDEDVRAELAALQAADLDADRGQVAAHPWLAGYQRSGRTALAGYLGSPAETDFDEVNRILAAFHAGAPELAAEADGPHPRPAVVLDRGRPRHPGARGGVDARQLRTPDRCRHPDPAEQHPGGDPRPPPRP